MAGSAISSPSDLWVTEKNKAQAQRGTKRKGSSKACHLHHPSCMAETPQYPKRSFSFLLLVWKRQAIFFISASKVPDMKQIIKYLEQSEWTDEWTHERVSEGHDACHSQSRTFWETLEDSSLWQEVTLVLRDPQREAYSKYHEGIPCMCGWTWLRNKFQSHRMSVSQPCCWLTVPQMQP